MSLRFVFANPLAFLVIALIGCGSDAIVVAPPSSARIHDKLLFDSKQDDPNGEIYSINLDGSGMLRIAPSPFVDVCPSVSPDGTEIAFFSSRDGGQLALHLMAADGSDVRFVDGPVYSRQCPVWSPDGREVAYFRYEMAGAATITSLRIISRNGTAARTITATDFNYYVAWSPDSRSLALLRFGPPSDSTKAGIYTASADGSNLTRIAGNFTSANNNISWSSDGALLLISCRDPGNFRSAICEMSPNGSIVRTMSPPSGGYVPVAWSPAGMTILFTRFAQNGAMDPVAGLSVMTADGSGQVVLVNSAGTFPEAEWSPDAKMVATLAYGGSSSEIFVVNADGTGARQLTNNSYMENHISWAPRGG